MFRSTWLRAVASATAGSASTANAFRFVASDMDGSILSPHHVLTEYASETLRRLTQDRHVPFIFATGRFYADVAAINKDLQRYLYERRMALPPTPGATWTPTPTYIITSNGAVVHNAETAEVVLERPVDPALVREIYHLLPASETRINTGVVQGDAWLYRMDWAEMLQFHRQSGCRFDVVPAFTGARGSDEALQHIHKIFFSSWDRPLLEKLEKTLQQRYGEELTVTFSAAYNVDITAKGVTKASALRSLFTEVAPLPGEALKDATPENRMRATIAFGDDLNDAAMLTEVGRGFVMGNCNPLLKARCPELEVIATNNDDAVAHKIREIFQLE